MIKSWTLDSWQSFDYQQAPHYLNQQELNQVVNRLSQFPSLVTIADIHALKMQLALVANGKAFLLQGGDCAELFSECSLSNINNKCQLLAEMSAILFCVLRKPIIQVGRMAGQYSKPRTSEYENREGIVLPIYRGDLINGLNFNIKQRISNPKRLLLGYYYSAITLFFIKSLREINGKNNFYQPFTSHEALHLYYEQALTRQWTNGLWYNVSTHFPWVGIRTSLPNSAHLEYIRGIQNPIALKIGVGMTPERLLALIETLNPLNEPGRLTLITRLGENNVQVSLPVLIQAVQKAGYCVVWSCDPMHANTYITRNGIKTRKFESILMELKQTVAIHQQLNSYLGGLHLELTADPVIECLGGCYHMEEMDVRHIHKSVVDPRLNYEQSLELVKKFSRFILY